MDKAREIWTDIDLTIVYEDHADAIVNNMGYDADGPHIIHFIEYSAYETLQARVQELEGKLEIFESEQAKVILRQSDKIQSLEQDLRDYKWEWEQACERERNRKEDIQSLEARLAEVVSIADTSLKGASDSLMAVIKNAADRGTQRAVIPWVREIMKAREQIKKLQEPAP